MNDYKLQNTELISQYKESGDNNILGKLVTLNYPLIIKLSKGFHVNKNNYEDLLQEGCIGLIQGINKFDQNKGLALSTYVCYWIRAYMFKFLIANSSITKLACSTEENKLFFNIEKEKSKLRNQNINVDDELQLIAQSLNIDVKKVKFINDYNNSITISLDSHSHKDKSNKNIIPSDFENIPDKLIEKYSADKLFSNQLELFKNTLNNKEKEIFECRILSDDPITFEEIGGKFLISKQRVQQIEAKLKERLARFVLAQQDKSNCVGSQI